MYLREDTPWLSFNLYMLEYSYCFLPYQVHKAIENKIEKVRKNDYTIDGVDWWGCYFKIKDGETIHVHAG